MGSVVVLATLVFIGWLIYRVVKGKQIKAHAISYGVATMAGIFTYVFFLNMDMPQLIKIVISIVMGITLIFLAAFVQRRRQLDKPSDS